MLIAKICSYLAYAWICVSHNRNQPGKGVKHQIKIYDINIAASRSNLKQGEGKEAMQ